jgi:hypothetical protein
MNNIGFRICATDRFTPKNGLPLIALYVITLWVKRGTVLFMCGIFSKEVLSKHVDVEYRFSAEPYISASCSNVSVLAKLCLRAKKTI